LIITDIVQSLPDVFLVVRMFAWLYMPQGALIKRLLSSNPCSVHHDRIRSGHCFGILFSLNDNFVGGRIIRPIRRFCGGGEICSGCTRLLQDVLNGRDRSHTANRLRRVPRVRCTRCVALSEVGVLVACHCIETPTIADAGRLRDCWLRFYEAPRGGKRSVRVHTCCSFYSPKDRAQK
jgi:hypothetical protein